MDPKDRDVIEFRVPLVRESSVEAVPPAEAAPQRPVLVRPCGTVVGDVGQMPLADRVGAVGVVAQNLGDGGCAPRDLALIAGISARPFGDDADPTACALRPVSRQALVGEHMAVTWKFEYLTPPAASASTCGVAISDP